MTLRFVRIALTCLGALSLPFVLVTTYLSLAGNGGQRNGNMDLFVFALALLVGCTLVALLPFKPVARVALSLVYLPAIGFVLLMWALVFVCSRYNDCL